MISHRQRPLFINTFDAIDTHILQTGQTLFIDNFHLVAFSESCSYKVTRIDGLKETLLSGERLVIQITDQEKSPPNKKPQGIHQVALDVALTQIQ
jgi:hypothetical protein